MIYLIEQVPSSEKSEEQVSQESVAKGSWHVHPEPWPFEMQLQLLVASDQSRTLLDSRNLQTQTSSLLRGVIDEDMVVSSRHVRS